MFRILSIVFIILLTLFTAKSVLGQDIVHKSIINNTDTVIDQQTYSSIEEIKIKLNHQIQKWHQSGFILASIDQLVETDTLVISQIFTGKLYKWDEIYTHVLPQDLKKYIQLKWGKMTDRIVHPDELNSLYKYIYEFAELQQTPFAEVYFDSLNIENERITARLNYDSGFKIKIDSIKLHYSDYLTESFIKNYYGLFHGMPYDITILKKINSRTQNLPFVKLSEPWTIDFNLEKNTLNLYLQDKKANQINAIVGLQPSPINNQRYMLTADALFKVYNTFGYGEMFHLTYQQFQNNSPKFHTALQWPYIMNTKWGADAQFELMKYDTLFRKTNAHVGAVFQKDEQNNFSIYYEVESNRAIHFDTQFLRINKRLPANLDVKKQGIGLHYQLGLLDNFMSPTKGIMLKISGATFSKKIIKNNAIEIISDKDIFNYHQLYDTLANNQFQFRLVSNFDGYWTVSNFLTIKFSNSNGWMGGNEYLSRNELFTIGGMNLLRGFNELSIFTSQYSVATLEPRVYIGDQSYVYGFTDVSYLKAHDNSLFSEYKWMTSLGLGAQLNTNNGLFKIAFALGKDGHNPLPKITDARVHIGYAIYF